MLSSQDLPNTNPLWFVWMRFFIWISDLSFCSRQSSNSFVIAGATAIVLTAPSFGNGLLFSSLLSGMILATFRYCGTCSVVIHSLKTLKILSFITSQIRSLWKCLSLSWSSPTALFLESLLLAILSSASEMRSLSIKGDLAGLSSAKSGWVYSPARWQYKIMVSYSY